MKNHTVRSIGAAVLCALWLALSLCLWFGQRRDISDTERRKLQQLPSLTWQSVCDGYYMNKFESFCQDQFPLREQFRTIKAVTGYGLTRRLDNNGIYLADGSAAQLLYPLNRVSAEKAAEKFQTIYDRYLKDGGGKILFSIAPDKGYYLAEKNGYPAMDYGALFDIFRSLPWAQFVDLTPALSAGSYYRTDTHWRQELLLDAASLLAQALEVDITDRYIPTALERPFYGVYYGQAALPMEPDTMYLLESDTLRSCTVTNHETGTVSGVYNMEKLTSRDLYDVFLSGAVSLMTMENPNAGSGRELIVFRDSFASSLVPLLAKGYAKITLVDIRYITTESLGSVLDFGNQDVLFLYSPLTLNQSAMLK